MCLEFLGMWMFSRGSRILICKTLSMSARTGTPPSGISGKATTSDRSLENPTKICITQGRSMERYDVLGGANIKVTSLPTGRVVDTPDHRRKRGGSMSFGGMEPPSTLFLDQYRTWAGVEIYCRFRWSFNGFDATEKGTMWITVARRMSSQETPTLLFEEAKLHTLGWNCT